MSSLFAQHPNFAQALVGAAAPTAMVETVTVAMEMEMEMETAGTRLPPLPLHLNQIAKCNSVPMSPANNLKGLTFNAKHRPASNGNTPLHENPIQLPSNLAQPLHSSQIYVVIALQNDTLHSTSQAALTHQGLQRGSKICALAAA